MVVVGGHGLKAAFSSSHGVATADGIINHFYFYLWDSDWGGTFWNANAYAPYPI